MANKVTILRNIRAALRLEPSDTADYIVSGRVTGYRNHKSINFLDLNDGSTKDELQVVVDKKILKKPEVGSFIRCIGNIKSSPGAKQASEFKINSLQYLGGCDPETYPLIDIDDSTKVGWYRRSIHLRPRAPYFASLFRVRSELELGLHLIMKQMDFFKVHTPTLTSNDSEASSDLFKVERTRLIEKANKVEDCSSSDKDETTELPTLERTSKLGYFNKDVFMVTSAQLHLEALAASLSRVYTISQTFRAENSITPRHLCEFLMFEAEESNVVELEPLMNRVESIIKFVAQFLCEVSDHKADIEYFLKRNSNHATFKKLSESKFIHMDYTEAIDILRNKIQNPGATVEIGADIDRTCERQLLEYCDNVPIFIKNYPRNLKPFYMKCDDTDEHALCFDLIAPFGGEICGGSLREDNYEKLKARLAHSQIDAISLQDEANKPTESSRFDWYLDLRKFGSFPHGGFGIGVDRLVQALIGMKNIKDATPFPRWVGNCPM